MEAQIWEREWFYRHNVAGVLLWFETTSTSPCLLKPTWAKVDSSYWRQTSLALEASSSLHCLRRLKHFENTTNCFCLMQLTLGQILPSETVFSFNTNVSLWKHSEAGPKLGRWKVQQNIVVSAGSSTLVLPRRLQVQFPCRPVCVSSCSSCGFTLWSCFHVVTAGGFRVPISFRYEVTTM